MINKLRVIGRVIFYILFLSLSSIAHAQSLSVESFEIDNNDISASASKTIRMDGNDEACGLIKVMLTEIGASFTGNIVGDIEHKVNQYWVYMVQGSRRLQLNVPGYPSLDIEFNNYDINCIKGKVTYKLVIKKTNTESSFIVLEGNKLNGHDYVDLGLSVMWASCNIGTDKSYEDGVSYAWADDQNYEYRRVSYSKQDYSSYASYFDCYITPSDQRVHLDYYNGGKELIVPSSGHDIARLKWGSVWRMPTKRECEELRDSCVWKLGKKRGQEGFTVTGPNGNSIFLPVSGVYWTSELAYDDHQAWSILLDSKTTINDYSPVRMSERYLAGYVRPVFDLNGSMENASPYNDKHSGITGHLEINCSPMDVEVFINGKSYGAVQNKVELPVGNYTVEISKEGYKSLSKVVYIREYGTSKLNETLISFEDEILYNDAIISFNNKEYENCFGVFMSLSKKNIADAQYMLGICYKNGLGVNKSNENAIKCFKYVAERGHARAQYEYGKAYDTGGIASSTNETLAAKWIRKAALQGDPDAQYLLGFLHYKGRGVDWDLSAARFWFHKAAEQGHKRAKDRLDGKL